MGLYKVITDAPQLKSSVFIKAFSKTQTTYFNEQQLPSTTSNIQT